MAAKTKAKPADELLQASATGREEQELYEFLDELGEGVAVIDIHLMRPDGSRPHAKRVTMDILRENPYDFLRAIRPGEDAKYILHFKGADRRIQTSKMIEVMGSKEPVINIPVALPGDSASERFFREQMILQQQQSDKMWTLMTAVIGGLAQRPIPEFKLPDPAAMLTSVVGAFVAIKGGTPTENVLEQVRPILELARDFSGNGSSAEDSLVKDLVKGLAPGIVQGLTRPALPATVQPVAPVSAIPPIHPVPHLAPPAPIPAQPIPPPPYQPPTIAQLVAQQILYLKKKAALGRPVEDWINYVLDETDEPGCQAVCYAIQNGATFENLLEIDAEIGQNPSLRQWFSTLYEGIRTELSASLHPGRGSGNAGDATHDEAAGPPRQP